MREIKFRAWDEDIKQMLPNVQAAYDTGYAESFGEVLRTKTQHVMQFTGLKDRNGRDIYEGDVCIGENNTARINKNSTAGNRSEPRCI